MAIDPSIDPSHAEQQELPAGSPDDLDDYDRTEERDLVSDRQQQQIDRREQLGDEES